MGHGIYFKEWSAERLRCKSTFSGVRGTGDNINPDSESDVSWGIGAVGKLQIQMQKAILGYRGVRYPGIGRIYC